MERAAPWINGYRESTARFLGKESGRPAHDPKQAFFSSSFLFYTVVFVFIKTRTLTHVKKIPPSSAKEKKTSINIYTFPSISRWPGLFFPFFSPAQKGVGNISVSVRRFLLFFFFYLFFTTRQQ
jgi:hypothetical protein